MQGLHNGRDDVAPGTPYDVSDARSPGPGILAAPLADGEEQLPPCYLFCALNGAGNLRILDRAGPPFLRAAAPINLDVIEAPLRELQEILIVMTLAASVQVLRAGVGVHAATVTTGVGVDPGPQAQAVNVAGDIGHVAISLTRLNGRPPFRVYDDV